MRWPWNRGEEMDKQSQEPLIQSYPHHDKSLKVSAEASERLGHYFPKCEIYFHLMVLYVAVFQMVRI